MAISYKPLWHRVLDRNMKRLEFRDFVGISNSTLSKLGKDYPVSLEVIERICIKMDCRIEDVVEVVRHS